MSTRGKKYESEREEQVAYGRKAKSYRKNNQSAFAKHMGIEITEFDYGFVKSMLMINQNI